MFYFIKRAHFEWDESKNTKNQQKHGVSFQKAQHAFLDRKRIIAEDMEHSQQEKRYYCFGLVDDGVMTVRFTYRDNKIRIIYPYYFKMRRWVEL